MAKNQQAEAPEDEYISLNSFKTFEHEGECVEGQLLGSSEIELSDGKTIKQFTVLSDDGMVTFNESFQLMILRRVPAGSNVRVTYTGQGPRNPKGNPIKQFDVCIKKSDFDSFVSRRQAPNLPAANLPAANLPADFDASSAFEEAANTDFADPFNG